MSPHLPHLHTLAALCVHMVDGVGTGVNLYTFGVALGPPNAEFGPLNVALGPPMFFFRFANFSNAYVHTTLDILAFRGFAVRNKKVSLFVKFFPSFSVR